MENRFGPAEEIPDNLDLIGLLYRTTSPFVLKKHTASRDDLVAAAALRNDACPTSVHWDVVVRAQALKADEIPHMAKRLAAVATSAKAADLLRALFELRYASWAVAAALQANIHLPPDLRSRCDWKEIEKEMELARRKNSAAS